MKPSRKMILIGASCAALGSLGGGFALAGTSSEDSKEGPDIAITGSALDKASAAALAEIGEGKVTGTEVGDEEGAYEIEVTRDDGTEVDVHLDESFAVLSSEDEGAGEEAGDDG